MKLIGWFKRYCSLFIDSKFLHLISSQIAQTELTSPRSGGKNMASGINRPGTCVRIPLSYNKIKIYELRRRSFH